MIKKKIFPILGFKAVWLSCFFGEIYFNSFVGFISGVIFLFCFIYLHKKKLIIIKTILIFSFIGYSFDSLLSYLNLYVINAQVNFMFLPLWFIVLWPSFCCLYIDVLFFLKNKKILSIILGLIFGPLTYYSAVTGGLAYVSNILVFFIISVFWALMMFFYSRNL